jgi:hypothetical protein
MFNPTTLSSAANINCCLSFLATGGSTSSNEDIY